MNNEYRLIDNGIKENFFDTNGRPLTRKSYFKRYIALIAGLFVSVFLFTLIYQIWTGFFGLETTNIVNIFFVVLMVPFCLLGVYGEYTLDVRRSRNIGRGNKLALCLAVTGLAKYLFVRPGFFQLLVSVISFLGFLYLLFAPAGSIKSKPSHAPVPEPPKEEMWEDEQEKIT